MKQILIAFNLLLLGTAAIAQDNYDISLLPKDLLPYASAVVRNEEISTEVKDLDYTIYHVKRAVTVLNKNGDDMIGLDISYDKNTSIRNIKGGVYNECGKLTQKIEEQN